MSARRVPLDRPSAQSEQQVTGCSGFWSLNPRPSWPHCRMSVGLGVSPCPGEMGFRQTDRQGGLPVQTWKLAMRGADLSQGVSFWNISGIPGVSPFHPIWSRMQKSQGVRVLGAWQACVISFHGHPGKLFLPVSPVSWRRKPIIREINKMFQGHEATTWRS